MDEMTMRRAIERKRQGAELGPDEWESLVASYMQGAIDDVQMAAMAMACVWRGLSVKEAAALTGAMVASGQTLRYAADAMVLDKHSSGGVSDIVSLVAVPIVAACGVRVAKLSGRALGHTGGTIDKLETIAGFNTSLSMDAFVAQVERVGCAIAAQSEAFVPADKRLYRLRDRTGTVPSMGLIAASIVSKKIACGAHAFVFDVKCGTAAFMHTPEDAIELAQMLVAISKEFGRQAIAIVSDMNEPLGHAIGTGIEVMEARNFLNGNEEDDRVRELSLHVASTMLTLAGVAEPRTTAARALDNGAAYEKLIEMVEAQGSSRAALESMDFTTHMEPLRAERDGYVSRIDAVLLGNVGREWSAKMPTAGIRTKARIGDRVTRGSVLAECYGDHARASRLQRAFTIEEAAVTPNPLIYATI